MPRYNTSHKQGAENASKYLNYAIKRGLVIDQKIVKNTRTNQQNRALHLYYKLVAEALLEVGYDFHYTNPMTGEIMSVPYDKDLVKDRIWRPLQEELFKIESTKELTTPMINDILTVLTPWLSKINKLVKFPNKFDQMVRHMNEHDKHNT